MRNDKKLVNIRSITTTEQNITITVIKDKKI